jgi:hypothetical protein
MAELIDTGAGDIEVGKLAQTVVVAAGVPTGRALIGAADAFVDNQSQFDRQARVCLRQSVLKVEKPVYLDYCAAQVTAWSDDEIAALKKILAWVARRFADWNFTLPSTVHLVKTTGQEEGRAAYTRRDDTIVLPAGKLESLQMPSPDSDPLFPKSSTDPLRAIVVHEFFHLISKNNLGLRESLYRLVGYEQLPNAVALPKVPWPKPTSSTQLPELKITNPDTPVLDVAITLDVPEDGGTRQRHLLPVLLSDGPYQGGSFFAYLGWYFMAVEEKSGTWKPVLDAGGRPLTYPMSDKSPLWPQYMDKIGRNLTNELFHPDEIIAQNFVFTALLPSSPQLTDIDKLLKKDEAS